jgi:hypothetical protein
VSDDPDHFRCSPESKPFPPQDAHWRVNPGVQTISKRDNGTMRQSLTLLGLSDCGSRFSSTFGQLDRFLHDVIARGAFGPVARMPTAKNSN